MQEPDSQGVFMPIRDAPYSTVMPELLLIAVH